RLLLPAQALTRLVVSLCLSCHSCIFFITSTLPPRSTLFPYTTLFRSELACHQVSATIATPQCKPSKSCVPSTSNAWRTPGIDLIDRKSTRLNSSHGSISYAVFCLKKKSEQSYTHANNGTSDTRATAPD